jgi:anti-sigma factor RsiW
VDCRQLDDLIEPLAEGETPPAEVAAHLAGCANCQARVALARSLDRLLATREWPAPPADFTARVMRRVSQDQWRTEQWVDTGFNIAVAVGVVLVLAGAAGLAWALGWLTSDPPTLAALGVAAEPWLARATTQARTLGMAALLLTVVLALWWWVEGEPA